jgi:hypothetical protein
VPIIATRGDAISEVVEKFNLGVVVDYGDAAGVAQAMQALLTLEPQALEAGFEQARQVFRWDEVVKPLVEFCRCPHQAPDKDAVGNAPGNPFYLAQLNQLRRLVSDYERGRVMRLLRHLHRLKSKWQMK